MNQKYVVPKELLEFVLKLPCECQRHYCEVCKMKDVARKALKEGEER